MKIRVRINGKENKGSEGGWKVRSTSREMADVAGRPARLEPLDVNTCIGRLIGLLSPAERSRLRTALGSSVLLVMGDPDQIAAMFFTLVECANRLVPGGSVTVLTTLLPLDPRLVSERTSNGCALLSFHAAARGGERICIKGPGYGSALRPLSSVRDIVERHNGCFRMGLRAKEISMNIYLPVLRHMPVRAGRSAGAAF